MTDTQDQLRIHIGHTVTVEVTEVMKAAITKANKLMLSGSTKIGAVRMIYPMIQDHSKYCIWYTIINGVGISSRGAVTYYYNVRK